ncbi:hypothetical protein AHMF7605_16015 [Adhaeribacter arboris]|uniref:Uncharacterized protein n=1 Tax=Adhaeribacter arboris TaxID=2072846 RepID=A0A2T2YHF2_9BACT|nr:hypothetical protein AHMF7605_16015 [Adhaeribacter arboris]
MLTNINFSGLYKAGYQLLSLTKFTLPSYLSFYEGYLLNKTSINGLVSLSTIFFYELLTLKEYQTYSRQLIKLYLLLKIITLVKVKL